MFVHGEDRVRPDQWCCPSGEKNDCQISFSKVNYEHEELTLFNVLTIPATISIISITGSV